MSSWQGDPVDLSEGAKYRRAVGRQGAAAPIALFRKDVGPILLLAALLAGLVGCAPSSGPELVAPSVLYVPHDPHSTAETPELHVEAADATVTFDAGDLRGIAVIKQTMDTCPIHLPVFHCEGQNGTPAGGGSFRVSPAKGTKAGDSAVLRYRVTSPGRPTVTGSTRIMIGMPKLEVDAHPDRLDVDPGGSLAVALTIRNTGDVPARGVSLFMNMRDGLASTAKHSNCRYKGGTSTWCRLPAAEVVIPPGASYRLGAREVLRADRDATHPTVVFQAAALGADYVPPDPLASQYRPGEGSVLRLVPVDARGAGTGTAHESSSELKVSVRNEADLLAVADTAKGPIGSRATVHVGVRNDGPGALHATVRVEFTVPPGTTVVSSPTTPKPMRNWSTRTAAPSPRTARHGPSRPRDSQAHVGTRVRRGPERWEPRKPSPSPSASTRTSPTTLGESPSPTATPGVLAMTPQPPTTPPRWPCKSGRAPPGPLPATTWQRR